MKERIPVIPKSVEKVVELEKPEVCMTVKLPYYHEFLINGEKRFYRSSMHTDMMYMLTETLRDLKPEFRNKLLIEGRVIDRNSWDKLKENEAFDFFWSSRFRRRLPWERREVAEILMPRSSRVTERQANKYIGLDFSPSSLSKRLGFGTGWYPAVFLMRKTEDETVYNSLAPYLGAVNQFRIGSRELKPGIVRMIGVRIMQEFERGILFLADSITDHVSDKVLEESAKIFKFG